MDLFKTMDSFVRVARTGSFAKAAEQLRVSRAIVSKHVQFLEAHLSARLINRSTRSLNLTEIGEAYLEFCVRILSQVEDERAIIAGLQSEPRGSIKVMAPKSFGNLFVSAAITDFVKRYPDVSVSLLLQEGSPSSRDLIEKAVDVAIRVSPVTDSSTISRQIGQSHWILCAAPSYLATHDGPSIPEELTQHNCLVHHKSAPDGVWILNGPRGKTAVTVTGTFSANSAIALRAATLKGLGIALLPLYSVSDDLRDGRLVEVLPTYKGPERPIIALYQHRPLLPAKVRLLVDFLTERVKEAPVSYELYRRQRVTAESIVAGRTSGRACHARGKPSARGRLPSRKIG